MSFEQLATIIGLSVTVISITGGAWLSVRTTIARIQTKVDIMAETVSKHDAQLAALRETTAVFKEVAGTLKEFVSGWSRKQEETDRAILELHKTKEDRK